MHGEIVISDAEKVDALTKMRLQLIAWCRNNPDAPGAAAWLAANGGGR